MSQFARILTVLICALSYGTAWAGGHEPPFVLPFNEAIEIPDGKGMSYFYGTWEVSGLQGGGPMTIMPGVIINEGSKGTNPDDEYRVLYETNNYVLVAELIKTFDGRSFTLFGVYFLGNVFASRVPPEQAPLEYRWCSVLRTSGPRDDMKSATAFLTWSDEKFLAEFTAGCALTIPGTYSWKYFGEGWGGALVFLDHGHNSLFLMPQQRLEHVVS